MQKFHFIVLFALLLIKPYIIWADQLILADFGNQTAESFPKGWKVKGLFGYKEPDGSEPYLIVANQNNLYLKGISKSNAVTIGKPVDYDLKKYGYLSWCWKIDKIPKNGAENKLFRSDSAAGLYVVFKGLKTIKYVWSSTLPVNTFTQSPFSSKTKIYVIRSGSQETGKWIKEKRNVVSDYKTAFKTTVINENPVAIAILTDSDSTNSSAVASYDDIVALSE